MTYFVVDIEADGPALGMHSMVSFGAVVLSEQLDHTFFGQLRPISEHWVPKALAVTGYTREETLAFPEPEVVISSFVAWVKAHTARGTHPQFVSDNNGFDFGFMSYYLWRFAGANPFGHSSRNMSDLYRGMQKRMKCSFTHLKETVHDHNPVNDALGNAEALLKMRDMGLRIRL
ncbi:MAG: exonuclease [Candidatus Paceibacterota bacterium]